MKFCPECGSMILPKKGEDGSNVFECKCGYKEVGGDSKITSQTKAKEIKDIEVPTGDEDSNLPTCEMECEKCGHKIAYYWEIQTRASDEPPTRFYKCEKCKYTWREYS